MIETTFRRPLCSETYSTPRERISTYLKSRRLTGREKILGEMDSIPVEENAYASLDTTTSNLSDFVKGIVKKSLTTCSFRNLKPETSLKGLYSPMRR